MHQCTKIIFGCGLAHNQSAPQCNSVSIFSGNKEDEHAFESQNKTQSSQNRKQL